MAFEQTNSTTTLQLSSEGNSVSSAEKSLTSSATSNGCFDCNICLDSSHDPVVTLCGHLYCWPCIYKWLQVQNSCPVCKKVISTTSLIPLYGRGTSISDSEAKRPQRDLTIPLRSQALGTHTSATSDQNNPSPLHQSRYTSHPLNNHNTSSMTTTTSIFSPTVYMVGEMVFARMFGSSDTGLFGYPYVNSYPFPANNSLRLRRQEMQLDKSLNRVSIFLFICIALCLVLF